MSGHGHGPCGPCDHDSGFSSQWCISIAVFLVIIILLFCVFLG